ncbi:MAG: urease accessory protein UreE [Candidatus Nephrothrix sp. EaCA]|nr:MAG: urease accessory protein UreE [Candidatus Nephrothrix sp. EaCA]
MILSHKVIGSVKSAEAAALYDIDWLPLEWYEAVRPIQRKKTNAGKDIALKFVNEGIRLKQGDVVWAEDKKCIAIEILPCEAIVIAPVTLLQMGTVCYEIGNKHLPLFIENEQVLVPFEEPLFKLLQAGGYGPTKALRRLENMLKVNAVSHSHGGESLFQKILNFGG